MKKRIKYRGEFELPLGVDYGDIGGLPPEGSIVTLQNVKVEITANERQRHKKTNQEGTVIELVYTAKGVVQEGAGVKTIKAKDDEQPTLEQAKGNVTPISGKDRAAGERESE